MNMTKSHLRFNRGRHKLHQLISTLETHLKAGTLHGNLKGAFPMVKWIKWSDAVKVFIPRNKNPEVTVITDWMILGLERRTKRLLHK